MDNINYKEKYYKYKEKYEALLNKSKSEQPLNMPLIYNSNVSINYNLEDDDFIQLEDNDNFKKQSLEEKYKRKSRLQMAPFLNHNLSDSSNDSSYDNFHQSDKTQSLEEKYKRKSRLQMAPFLNHNLYDNSETLSDSSNDSSNIKLYINYNK